METVRTLYDFDGDNENGELSFAAGETITLTSKDVGEGWWEGQKSDGTVGLFPESYVEANQEEASSPSTALQAADIGSTPDGFLDMPPPPVEQSVQVDDIFGLGFDLPKSNNTEPSIVIADEQQSQMENVTSNSKDWETSVGDDHGSGDWSDEWAVSNTVSSQPAKSSPIHTSQTLNSSDVGSPVKRTDRKTTVRLGNIFSSFTKTAATSFVLGESKADLSGAQSCQILLGEDGPMWENNAHIFTCKISDPVKESKFSGLKSFIAYNITPSHTNNRVMRRFKHFDWLYEQLARKFGVAISVPPLPDKQITGRYEEDFIEERRQQLEAWIGRIALHPIISRSEVLQHFVTSNDDERAWKAGKRKAEKDEAVSGAFLNTLETPEQQLDLTLAEQELETHIKFTKSMDESCKQLLSMGQDHTKKCMTVYRRENQKLGQVFESLSEAFELDEREVSQPLTEALKHSAECYKAIGEVYYEQPKCDWFPFLSGLNEYKTVLSTFPGILGNQKSALEKNKEVRRLHLENKVTQEEMEDATTRTEKLCYAVQAEVNHFQHYRVGDFAVYMKHFLEDQISFHKEMVKKLEEAATHYRDLVDE